MSTFSFPKADGPPCIWRVRHENYDMNRWLKLHALFMLSCSRSDVIWGPFVLLKLLWKEVNLRNMNVAVKEWRKHSTPSTESGVVLPFEESQQASYHPISCITVTLLPYIKDHANGVHLIGGQSWYDMMKYLTRFIEGKIWHKTWRFTHLWWLRRIRRSWRHCCCTMSWGAVQ